jgi:GNAT superfamily N-acetyltransferase
VNIREMEQRDLEAVSAICIDSFSQSVAGSLSKAGVATFSSIAASSAFLNRMQQDNVMFVAERDGKINGVIELKEGRHVAMLFVAPECQKQGVGRALLATALRYARVDTVTVKASLSSVVAYEKYDFKCNGGIAETAGLVFQPMEITLCI